MTVDPRELVEKDKRLPTNMAGDANKLLAVKPDETGYEHSQFISASDISGQIIMWPTDTPPSGYLVCDGAQYNVDSYPTLGGILGGIPGGTFNVPDLTDRFPKGSGGANTNTQEVEEIGPHDHDSVAVANHNHSLSINSVGSHQHVVIPDYKTGKQVQSGGGTWCIGTGQINTTTTAAGAHGHTGSVGSAGGHDHTISPNTGTKNQPACTLINFCIKT